MSATATAHIFQSQPNAARRCTVHSLAAHSLYQQSHAQLQFYPEGVLVMERAQFFSRDGRSAGIRNSYFINAGKPWPLSIKLEGAVRLGSRKVSRRHCCVAQVNDYLVVRDLGSTNGVRINGERVAEGKLVPGDELQIGNFKYQVCGETGEPRQS